MSDINTLDSMCELIIDCPHFTPKWTDEGRLVLRNQNIKNGVLNLSSPSFTNEYDYQRRIKRATPRAGDIVFTREAPMGEVCMIPEGVQCCLGQRQVLLRPKSKVCGEYLFWALQSPFVQHQISWNEGTGSTVSNVRIPVLKALNIPRHPKKEVEIAKILSDIAGKIQLNRQTNQTLEQIAQAIFKSWFVDFEPTRAKIAAKENGQDPERATMAAISGKTLEELDQLPPEQQQKLKTTAALFSDALVDSELGEVPEGWEVKDVKYFGKVVTGKTPPKKNVDAYSSSGSPFITPTDINNELFVTSTNRCLSGIGQNLLIKTRITAGSICITCIGSQMGELFDTTPENVLMHLKNIYKDQELDEIRTTKDFLVVRQEGKRKGKRSLKHYSLDAIISVGYRVSSTRATQFRIWATNLLKQHLVHGYTLNQKRLQERGIEFDQAVQLLSQTLENQQLISSEGTAVLNVVSDYARSWSLLQGYDEQSLSDQTTKQSAMHSLALDSFLAAITELKRILIDKGEATELFGQLRGSGLESAIATIEQGFGDELFYPNVASRAAHLLYFVIKNHPLADGNKRPGSFLFLWYLRINQNFLAKPVESLVNDNTLVALALLVAESKPEQKELIIRLIQQFILLKD